MQQSNVSCPALLLKLAGVHTVSVQPLQHVVALIHFVHAHAHIAQLWEQVTAPGK